MVIMFNRDHAALLSIQLYVMCQVYAEILSDTAEYRNMLVSRGDFVILTCNISTSNATQIHWTKGSSVFSYLVLTNKTVSNFTSHKIDVNLPTKLNISNVQHDDTGLYKCVITGKRGSWTVKWNLTVSRESEENSQLWSFLHILTAVTGLICVFTSAAVCLYRKCRTKTPNQDQESRALSYAQFRVQFGKEVAPPAPFQSCAEYTTQSRQRESVRLEAQFNPDKHDLQYKAE
ncbi:uncharacterized protein LOC117952900 isoform X1 [Etheostoma cragini]|uniref:uncharacterized protein LOC117952900 isoform X1 n=1 Tax=Etheostoma cragini TaxID=417921 RepID=UPI00155F4585|nr:uncharacterized protein LOC117952900 isoform X1 [Etheostoma cragini]